MKLIAQPNGWSCFPTSLAMVLDIDINQIFKVIGHDGSEIIWPREKDPERRRSFHSSEIVTTAWGLGFTTTWFEGNRCLGLEKSGDIFVLEPLDVIPYLKFCSGILTGIGSSGKPHAVAWDAKEQLIYDPNYTVYALDEFQVSDFYAISKKT